MLWAKKCTYIWRWEGQGQEREMYSLAHMVVLGCHVQRKKIFRDLDGPRFAWSSPLKKLSSDESLC